MFLWQILEHMGYKVNVDFGLIDNKGVVSINWWSHPDPQPTQEQIDAAVPAALAALTAEDAKRVESTTARDDAKRALAALDTIVATAPTATIAQIRTDVEQMARIIKHLIVATVGR